MILLTGINYDHRRDWVESKLLTLASAFSIDVAAYAVMSNHLHLVLSVDIYQSNRWTDREVVEHWHQVFKGTEITDEVIKSVEITQFKHSISQSFK